MQQKQVSLQNLSYSKHLHTVLLLSKIQIAEDTDTLSQSMSLGYMVKIQVRAPYPDLLNKHFAGIGSRNPYLNMISSDFF